MRLDKVWSRRAKLRDNLCGDPVELRKRILMDLLLAKAGGLALLFALLSVLAPRGAARIGHVAADQATSTEAEKVKHEETKNRAKLIKTHFENGNQVMQDAQAIRQQLQRAANHQETTLLAKMKADYQTAITEYELALEDTRVNDKDRVRVIGLLGIIRNGLVSQEKAVEMLVQNKDLPVILSNLGMAYGGLGEYQEAITMLQQAAILKPAARTYMELGTDLAQVGRMQEATAICDKILTVDPTAKNVSAGCYKNIAIVAVNAGKLAEAIVPLQKATELNPQDALAWKLLGDALSTTVSTKSVDGKIVYVIPTGTIEAYQKYLQLEPRGTYAGQVQAALEEISRLAKRVSATEGKEKN
jgi:tetratricopeptide (TPR) repeat protein